MAQQPGEPGSQPAAPALSSSKFMPIQPIYRYLSEAFHNNVIHPKKKNPFLGCKLPAMPVAQCSQVSEPLQPPSAAWVHIASAGPFGTASPSPLTIPPSSLHVLPPVDPSLAVIPPRNGASHATVAVMPLSGRQGPRTASSGPWILSKLHRRCRLMVRVSSG